MNPETAMECYKPSVGESGSSNAHMEVQQERSKLGCNATQSGSSEKILNGTTLDVPCIFSNREMFKHSAGVDAKAGAGALAESKAGAAARTGAEAGAGARAESKAGAAARTGAEAGAGARAESKAGAEATAGSRAGAEAKATAKAVVEGTAGVAPKRGAESGAGAHRAQEPIAGQDGMRRGQPEGTKRQNDRSGQQPPKFDRPIQGKNGKPDGRSVESPADALNRLFGNRGATNGSTALERLFGNKPSGNKIEPMHRNVKPGNIDRRVDNRVHNQAKESSNEGAKVQPDGSRPTERTQGKAEGWAGTTAKAEASASARTSIEGRAGSSAEAKAGSSAEAKAGSSAEAKTGSSAGAKAASSAEAKAGSSAEAKAGSSAGAKAGSSAEARAESSAGASTGSPLEQQEQRRDSRPGANGKAEAQGDASRKKIEEGRTSIETPLNTRPDFRRVPEQTGLDGKQGPLVTKPEREGKAEECKQTGLDGKSGPLVTKPERQGDTVEPKQTGLDGKSGPLVTKPERQGDTVEPKQTGLDGKPGETVEKPQLADNSFRKNIEEVLNAGPNDRQKSTPQDFDFDNDPNVRERVVQKMTPEEFKKYHEEERSKNEYNKTIVELLKTPVPYGMAQPEMPDAPKTPMHTEAKAREADVKREIEDNVRSKMSPQERSDLDEGLGKYRKDYDQYRKDLGSSPERLVYMEPPAAPKVVQKYFDSLRTTAAELAKRK